MSSSNRPPLVSCSPWAVLVVLLFVAFYFAWQIVGPRLRPVHDPDAVPRLVVPRGDLADDEQSTIALFRAAAPSVVHIMTSERGIDRFRMRAVEIPIGSGSGIVWDERGYIVTNFHVLQGASRATVTLDDQSEHEATLVGFDPSYDIAVLKIDVPGNTKLVAIPIGSSDDLLVGQKVFAIGNPFGLDHTLTTGVISGLNREIPSLTGRPIRGVIQTDAAINPGNSGGPLLDSAGRLIGMNTAIAGQTGANIGIGFAVPIGAINMVAPSIVRFGRYTPPRLGVRPASNQVARIVRVPGFVIESVVPDSAAARAGLRSLELRSDNTVRADVIQSIDGKPVMSMSDIQDILADHRPGDVVKVGFVRDGRALEVDVTLIEEQG